MSDRASEIVDALDLFAAYLKVTGVAHLGPEPSGDARLLGRRLGLLNGSSWVALWANYFGRLYLPGVQLVSAGNDAVQLSFMAAHARRDPCPPQSNIDAFERQAREMVVLADVDAILITCSTMNRAYPTVERALAECGVPVVQIDAPMMEEALEHEGDVLVVATHGPTVESTCRLLDEAAARTGRASAHIELVIPQAWDCLAAGDVVGHNRLLHEGIRRALTQEGVGCVVLAQLSMAVYLLSYPDASDALGVPVLTSARCGFGRVRRLLEEMPARSC